MKKIYLAPVTKTYQVDAECEILTGSDESKTLKINNTNESEDVAKVADVKGLWDQEW